MSALPAYTGPAARCPKCATTGVMTEWHHAGGVLGPEKMLRRPPPCRDTGDLAAFGGQGEHLCRLCTVCGYGWAEACADTTVPASQLRSVPGQEEE